MVAMLTKLTTKAKLIISHPSLIPRPLKDSLGMRLWEIMKWPLLTSGLVLTAEEASLATEEAPLATSVAT